MSLPASVSKLASPIKELVQSVAESDPSLLGKTDNDKKEVEGWIEKVGEGSAVKPDNYRDLESTLTPRTYIATNYFTAADVALYGALHPIISKLEPAQHYSHPSITRYFDHIQSRPPVRKSAETLSSHSLVTLNFEDAPKLERVADAPKKKEKVPKDAASAPAPDTKAKEEGKQQNTEKKDKKKEKAAAQPQEAGKKADKKQAGGKAAAKAAPADDGEPVPSMIDLRVGHIIDVKKHPDADGLYIEQIDLGEETGPRTVVSGLVNYVPIEQMQDKWLVAVCNLKPANMRGVKSFAMVLCATSKDGKEGGIELIQPPANSKVGERVYFEGGDYENAEPLSQLNPKKKIFETIQPGFITLDSREAAWINPTTKSVHKIRTKDGVCVAPTIIEALLGIAQWGGKAAPSLIDNMGGSAFADLPQEAFPRLPPALYLTLKGRLREVVQNLYEHVAVPHEAPQKQDYGDVDFVVYYPRSGRSSVPHEEIQEALGATHVIPAEGNRTSNFAVPITQEYKDFLLTQNKLGVNLQETYFCQVDINVCLDKNEWERVCFFHSYGDMGMILGLLGQNVGLAWGLNGLRYPQPPYPPVVLSTDHGEIADFFGLSMTRWSSGFDTQEDVFQWIVASRLFDPLRFRSKGQKVKPVRTMYHNFVRWVDDRIEPEALPVSAALSLESTTQAGNSTFTPRQEEVREEALVHFGKKTELEAFLRQTKTRETLKKVFNGHNVRDWAQLGTRWKTVKLVMDAVREKFGGDEGLMNIIETEGEDGIKRRVLECSKDLVTV
ncbi:G4 quadruplex nucleic acid binding protein [Marasmius crinis-equi]|uniref:G4 quadruplex nucleic acid binding protein n=1 Tax=Marasmius crinis-equi TaxID=585013 RepID=A0ABR3FT24_9AGAR